MKIIKKVIYIVLALSLCLSLCVFTASAAPSAYGSATVKATSLNVRSGPGTSYSRISSIKNGTRIVILEKTNSDWYKISYSGITGYVSSEYLVDVTTENSGSGSGSSTGTVNASSLNVRSGPGTSYRKVAVAPRGTSLVIVEKANSDWYKVSYSGITGYVSAEYIIDIKTVEAATETLSTSEPTPTPKAADPAPTTPNLAYGAATVNATSLNIRSGAGSTYDRVTVVSKGTRLVILEKTNSDWYKVNYCGNVGYAATEYLTDVLTAENFDATGTIKASGGVNVRSKPNTDSGVVGSFSSGKELHVTGINNGWYKINQDGVVGYIRSDFVDITGSSATVSAPGNSVGQQIANLALNYVGYRYVYGEESPSKGFDCSGLVYYVYGQYGYKLDRTASQQYKSAGYHVAKSELQAGDLLFFSSNGSSVTHVGIYIGDGQFVHASTSKTGVIISDLNSSYYKRVWFGANRVV